MLFTGYKYQGPAAVRYPRGKGIGVRIEQQMEELPIGKGKIRRKGSKVAFLAFGSMVNVALEAADAFDATVVDMRFIKPMDEELIGDMATGHQLIVTLEENAIIGGAGSGVNEFLLNANYQIPILNLGLPDRFLDHGKVPNMLARVGLNKESIIETIKQKLLDCKIHSEAV